MFITFIVVDNKASEMRTWSNIIEANNEFEKQKELTEKTFGFKHYEDTATDNETYLAKSATYERDGVICIIYMYNFPNRN